MNSIFASSFIENLKRIQGESSRAPKGESKPPHDFSQVLGDIERRQKISHSDSTLGQDRAISEPLKPSPTAPGSTAPEFLVSADNPLFRLTKAVGDVISCEVQACDSGVKSLGIDVKTLAVDAIDLEAELPQPPVIRATSRVTMSVPGDREPIQYSRENIEEIISTAGKYHGIDPDLSMAVAKAESAFRPDAVSKDGFASKGIFQLLDSTAGDLIGRFDVREQYDPFDPAMNAFLGVGYLRRLHDLFSEESNLGGSLRTRPVSSGSDLEKIALAAFNAGEGNVARAQARAERLGKDPGKFESVEPFLPPSTRTYVTRVTEFRTQFARARSDESIG